MARSTITAVFPGETEAQAAQEALRAAGLNASDVVRSINMTDDAIAAEWPGQAYENQETKFGAGVANAIKSGFGTAQNDDSLDAQRMAAVQQGSVILSVTTDDEKAVRETLERCGAISVR